ncbi:FAD:protein FMN transferase [Ideonella sp. DXS29W]|uniref:FAD:protein FMN transferase n=1 Tax=Ideonella lacteola TaxID=2984193 RepID=A0ABU9BTJ7_9BURK
MKRRPLLLATLSAGLSPASPAAPQGLVWRRRDWIGFGTTLSLRAGAAQADRLEQALDEAVRVARQIEAQMSLFDPDSALSRLNREGRLERVPAELMTVLRLAQWVSRHTSGAFDATVQPLWQLFEHARQEGRVPSATEVAQTRSSVGWQGLRIEPGRVAFSRRGMSVTLNGIAQGHACDRVREVLHRHGIAHALIDTGEWATMGGNANGQPWHLGVADPRGAPHPIALIAPNGQCVATSADSPSDFTPDHRHHHIVDPNTGWSPPQLAAVTVAARRAALADALTKPMFMAGPDGITSLARRWGVEVLWVDKQGRRGCTPGWHLLDATRATA